MDDRRLPRPRPVTIVGRLSRPVAPPAAVTDARRCWWSPRADSGGGGPSFASSSGGAAAASSSAWIREFVSTMSASRMS